MSVRVWVKLLVAARAIELSRLDDPSDGFKG
jgi:hypothetical protein